MSQFNVITSNLNVNTSPFNATSSTCIATIDNGNATNEMFDANMTWNHLISLAFEDSLIYYNQTNISFEIYDEVMETYVDQLFYSFLEALKHYYHYAFSSGFFVHLGSTQKHIW